MMVLPVLVFAIFWAFISAQQASQCIDKSSYCQSVTPDYHCSVRFRNYWSIVRHCPKTCSICTEKCGYQQHAASRVLGGTDVKPGQWPWSVAVWINNNYECGGVLINSEFVLTSAACIGNAQTHQIRVSVGETDITKPDGEQFIPVFKIIRHSLYKGGQNYDNNIALLELRFHARFGNLVQPVCLAKGDVKPGTTCYLTGWGKAQRTGGKYRNAHPVLQQVALKITSNKDCHIKNQKGHPITAGMICGAPTNPMIHQGACLGDFGSPLVCPTSTGAWELHGIVSSIERTCNTSLLDTVFTRISAFRQWIENNANSSA